MTMQVVPRTESLIVAHENGEHKTPIFGCPVCVAMARPISKKGVHVDYETWCGLEVSVRKLEEELSKMVETAGQLVEIVTEQRVRSESDA